MAEVGLSIESDIVHHAVIEGVPEVFETAGLGTGHAEMVAEAREVGLTRHANGHVVGDVVRLVRGTTVVTCWISTSATQG